MTIPAIIAFIYAALLLIGGIIGLLKSGSYTSFYMGVISSFIMDLGGVLIWKGQPLGFRISILASFLLFLFFSYRYWETHKIMPAAIFSGVSFAVFLIMFLYRRPWE
jgi:uncharacterized membrane protein (UPF0136 family)